MRTTRPSEDDDDDESGVEHAVTIDIGAFHTNFLINYCSTTHKVQGDTITEDFTIWDWHRMDATRP